MNYRSFYIGCLIFIGGYIPIQAQLNAPEKILIDSFSIYPERGFLIDNGYVIGGEEESCNTATLWLMDKAFNIIRKKYLRHDVYEISEVYDMKRLNATIQVLTRQVQYEDVVGDDGIKWYSLNTDLEAVDSLYIPKLYSKDGLLLDSLWVFSTWEDSLVFISAEDGRIVHSIGFNNGSNELIKSGSRVVSWNDSQIYIVDSTYKIDTINVNTKIIDLEANQNELYILTESSVLHMKVKDHFMTRDSIVPPPNAQQLMYHPIIPALIVVTNQNSIHYYNPDSLVETGEIQLFHSPVYKEDLNFLPLSDGSILRLGTTRVMLKSKSYALNGQAMGFLHRIDQNYSEDSIKRSNLTLEEFSIIDDYYGSKPKLILGDSVYFVTTDSHTKMKWIFKNVGTDTIFSAFTSTSQVYGFNCAEGFYSQVLRTFLSPDMSFGKTFEFQKERLVPNGYQKRHMVYTAYPNGHYDADFSDNQKQFALQYVISSSDSGPDPRSIQIYPNPANNEIHIASMGKMTIQKVELIDSQGKTFVQYHIDHAYSPIKIDVTSVPGGMYLLRLHTPSGLVMKRVTIIK